MYDKLVTKVNKIDTSGFVLKTEFNADKSDLEKKISDADKKNHNSNGIIKETNYSAKISETESKTFSISGLSTDFSLTPVKNKIPDVNN